MAADAHTLSVLKSSAETIWQLRWQMSWDMNNDNTVDVADFLLLAAWFFFAPGDLVLLLLMIYATPAALFLTINPESLSGVLSGVISSAVWIATLWFFARR